MQIAKNILFYVSIGIIVLILGGLAGWYFYLRSKTSSTEAVDSARGLGIAPPTFPGGLGSTAANNATGSTGTGNGQQSNPSTQRLWQVDHAPVAGTAFDIPSRISASSTDLYFAERASGYVFKANAQTQRTERVSNTLLPKIYEALFIPGQKAVLLRSLDESGAITTFSATYASTTAATSSSPVALAGRYLAKNIRSIALDPKTGALFYLTPDTARYGAIGSTALWNGTKAKQVFSSPQYSWQTHYMGTKIVLTESAADDLLGYAYTLQGGTLVPLIGPVPGLQVLPHPSENAFLYSASGVNALALYVQAGKSDPAALSIRTTTEKCVWAPGKSLIAYCAVPSSTGSQFLNRWHQGAVHTTDTWWEIDTANRSARMFYSMPRALDVQNPQVDPSGNYIAFINGSDQSLWLLRIAQ